MALAKIALLLALARSLSTHWRRFDIGPISAAVAKIDQKTLNILYRELLVGGKKFSNFTCRRRNKVYKFCPRATHEQFKLRPSCCCWRAKFLRFTPERNSDARLFGITFSLATCQESKFAAELRNEFADDEAPAAGDLHPMYVRAAN